MKQFIKIKYQKVHGPRDICLLLFHLFCFFFLFCFFYELFHLKIILQNLVDLWSHFLYMFVIPLLEVKIQFDWKLWINVLNLTSIKSWNPSLFLISCARYLQKITVSY